MILGAIPYTGNKQSLIPQIKPFPKHDRLIDLFCGGLSVSLSSDVPVISNDLDSNLINLYSWMKTADFSDVIKTVEKYNLDNKNKEAYLKLRADYNQNKDPLLLYVLIQHSFSNMIRFQNNNFNAPFGQRSLTRNTEKRWNLFKKKKDLITLENKNFYEIEIKKNDFVYCDPPYLITQAEYNKHWSNESESRLLSFLDSLSEKGIKFGLSNVIEHAGKRNELLIDWMKKYDVQYLNKSYIFNSYHSDKKKTIEVYITN